MPRVHYQDASPLCGMDAGIDVNKCYRKKFKKCQKRKNVGKNKKRFKTFNKNVIPNLFNLLSKRLMPSAVGAE